MWARAILSLLLSAASLPLLADLIVSDTNALHAVFSALMPPFATWNNRDETINLPFSVSSTTSNPLELSMHTTPVCNKNTSNPHSVCMANTSDNTAMIQYTIKYIPCGSIKPFYLSEATKPVTTITLSSQYTQRSKCQAEPGLMSFTRLSLLGQPIPKSGLYKAQIMLEIKEI